MVINFDIFDNFEKPTITVCNPNKEELFAISGVSFGESMVMRYNSMSEISLTVPKEIEGVPTHGYDDIKSKRLINVTNFGYFIITTINKVGDGVKEVKEITAYSLEAELNFKKLNLFSGTYKFYDPITPTNTLLGQIVKYVPSWKIGYVDSELWNKYRTFDISDQTIYNFLMTTVEESFECIFTFDTVAKTINAYSVKNAVSDTSIYLSFDNLIKQVTIEEMSEELVTALHCYGGGDLDIRTVNPLGTPIMYNFDYFLNSEDMWFSDSLKVAVQAWTAKIASLQPVYANYLANFRTKNQELLTLQAELSVLQNEYEALEAIQKARISAGQSYTDIYTQMQAKEVQIKSKQTEITNKKNEIVLIKDSLGGINSQLSFAENFTQAQYEELSNYIIEGTYQNEAFIQTGEMTPVEIQNMAQELYDQCTNVLTKLSQPRFSFSMDSANFLFLKEFKPFTDQLSLGSQIYVDIGEGMISYPVLLELSFSFDNPTDFSMTYGNRLRLDKNDFVFSELFGDSVTGGNTISFNSTNWSDWKDNYQDEVSTFINSALDCTKNSVINAVEQEITITRNGLKGQKYIPETDTYDPKKVWMTNNAIAFTKDNWQTASLAIGEVGNGVFGVVGDAIIGKLLAGNQLTITNDKNNFLLDSNGCVLNNSTFTLTTDNNKGKIILDPVAGIKIQGNTGTGFVDKFFVDTSGNVNFTGKLNGATGSFSGDLTSATFKSGSININNKFMVDAFGNCTATSMTITGGSFNSGNINGTNITGGSLNIGSGNFTVNAYGQCTARDIDIVGGSINIDEDIYVGGNIRLRSSSTVGTIQFYTQGVYATEIRGGRDSGGGFLRVEDDLVCDDFFTTNIEAQKAIVHGNIYMKGSDLVATQSWVSNQLPNLSNYTTLSKFESKCPSSTAYDSGTGNLKFYNTNGNELRDMRVNLL